VDKYHREHYRKKKFCPVKNCHAKAQVRLAAHLKVYHPEISRAERLKLTKTARVAPRKVTTPKPTREKTLLSFFKAEENQKPSPLQQAATSVPIVGPQVGTRNFARYDIDKQPSLMKFKEYLQSIQGRMRKPRVATAIAVDVSKCLAYFSGGDISVTPPWEALLNEDEVHRYVDYLRESEVIGVDGILTKLDRLGNALEFIKATVLQQDDQPKYHKVQRVQDAIKRWKAGLRPLKKMKNLQRLEAISEEALSLEEVNTVVENRKLWKGFDSIVRRIEGGDTITRDEQTLCLGIVLVMLLFKNWQRPGAVINMTTREYRQARPITEEGKEVLVIAVLEHKTEVQGPANVTCAGEDIKMLRSYHNLIRPFCDPDNQCHYFLTVPGGGQVKKPNYYIQKLQKEYGVQVPTATRVRKIGCTTGVTQCSDPENALLAAHMGHSQPTQRKYYEAIMGKKHAASAHLLREKLRMQSSKRPCESSDEVHMEVQNENVENEKEKPRRRRRCFTPKETAEIADKFASFIKSMTTPPIPLCQEYIKEVNMSREAKDIQDKVRNLIKYQKD